MVRAVHSAINGRVRFKVDGLHRSEALKRHIENGLDGLDGITVLSISTTTGSLLVSYKGGNTWQSIVPLIEEIVAVYKSATAVPQTGDGGNGKKSTSVPTESQRQSKSLDSATLQSRRKLRKLVVDAQEQPVEKWHLLDAGTVLRFVATDGAFGLTDDIVKQRLKQYGPNMLPESVPRSGFSIFIEQFKSLPVALLGVAAAVSVVTGGVADAIVIMAVVVTNAGIGYATESQSEKTINSLKSLVRPTAFVIRNGEIREIGAEGVVPGDILALRPGTYVPADARLIDANRLSVDESTLTGESLPVLKITTALRPPEDDTTGKKEIPLGDRTNMVYMGTIVTGGQGAAVVTATGKYTEIGHIQTLVGSARPPQTPMERQLDTMGRQLVLISGAVCGIVFLIGLLRGYGFLQMLKISISLAVAAVPEGLPTVATTTLSLGIRRMRKHNVLIRHLDAVETLGSLQTICMDKTGTITLNRMSIVALHTGKKQVRISDGIFYHGGRTLNPYECDELLRLIHVAVLCNESEVQRCTPQKPCDGLVVDVKGTGLSVGLTEQHIVSGSSTENALIHMALAAGIDVILIRNKFPRSGIGHRAEMRNFMTTTHSVANNGKLIALKGSPAEVLQMCNRHIVDGELIPLSDDDRMNVEIENERMAGNALRVLGLAYNIIENGDNDVDTREDFIWLGLTGMADPVRNGVGEVIDVFHSAGIDTVMITGDQSATAYAIGKELNLSRGEQLEILDSTHLTDIEPEVLKALCEKVHVFARVSPANKLQIVQSLQSVGKIVAMTGDGINDGPALKAADIGIAMGHTGTDVAREVADVVLEDDNLETMIIAISQGRTIYNNIRKSVHFLLSTNMSEIIVMFTAIAGGMGHPLNAMQLLWINLLSDIAPGLALALEQPEPDVLARPPRDPGEPIIKTSDFKRIGFESAVLSAGSMSAYLYGISRYGIGPSAGTMAFASLTLGQLLHAYSCRSETHGIFDKAHLPPNPYLNAAIAGSIGLQMLAMVVPGLRTLLGITPIGFIDWLVVGGSAVVPLIVNEATKTQKKAADNRRLSMPTVVQTRTADAH
ncbi:MAG: HAD-IC family P-type ATPase [Dissulfurispiraceae bacterium]